MTATTRKPLSVTPRSLRMIPLSVDEPPDSAELVEIPPDHECLPDDVRLGHESPVSAVAAAVPVVSHQEVVSRRHLARKAGVIVGAILPEGKRAHARQMH